MAVIVVWVCEAVKAWLSPAVCCCFTDGRVVKFLVEQNSNNALHGQVTIGTLILQVTSSFLFHSSRVETFAQFGVVFLLFALGLEFSLTKLKAVGHVAVLGGLLQIAIFMFLCGITVALCGAKLSEGDCAVGLLFALLLVLGGNNGLLRGMVSMGKLLLVLSIYLAVTSILSWSFVPYFLKLMIQLSSQTNVYQLAAVAFCL
ncbi:hypothetical protein AB3S75_044977 [Citrus x aurantiifolia]